MLLYFFATNHTNYAKWFLVYVLDVNFEIWNQLIDNQLALKEQHLMPLLKELKE